jgi:hypothetical protein
LRKPAILPVKKAWPEPELLISFLTDGMRLVPLDQVLPTIGALLDNYADAPMNFADACVIRLAELNDALTVCTVDEHFRFFHKQGNKPGVLLAPFMEGQAAYGT